MRRLLANLWGIEITLGGALTTLGLLFLTIWLFSTKNQVIRQLSDIDRNTAIVPKAIIDHNQHDIMEYEQIKACLQIILDQDAILEKELKAQK